MKTLDETYQIFVEKLMLGIPFAFSRFGDGEWNCIFGKDGTNCDGHEYFHTLGAQLRSIIQNSPKYWVGIQELALKGEFGDQVAVMVEKYDRIEWVNADVLHKKSIYGEIGPFFKALRKRNLIIVGPPYLASLDLSLHLVIPEQNCWLHYSDIVEQLRGWLAPDVVVILCAGMMSKVVIDDLADFQQSGVTLLDLGSLLDPFAGKFTRAYHKQLEPQTLTLWNAAK